MQNIEIFTGPGCHHCQTAKDLLKKYDLPFVERDVSDPAEMEELRKRLPRVRSLPQIFADGEHLGNDEDLRLRLRN